MTRFIHVVSVRFLVVATVFSALLFVQQSKSQAPAKPLPAPAQSAAQSIDELRRQLEKELADTHTPGLSVAIVRRDGPEWVAGLGLADVANHRAATSDTLFRIGSTSKAFASLAILQLVNEGKLSLDDPVRKLVPEVWFENRWESTDPVRVVHLLEHTTGWDDLHEASYKSAPAMTLRDALAYNHHSRISRWPPGTRYAYCNSGPPVAAYIVEKITGQRFEDYVQRSLFAPMGMKTATYFQPDAPATTILYHDDGKTSYSYWNILLRPAGSINASANDMAAYLSFYLNRGTVHGTQIVPAASIDRMEVPASTWAAKGGLKCGYGLGNVCSINDGFVYHGHTGAVPGGLTELAYLPEYGVGYFFSTNSRSFETFKKIGEMLRAYITRNLTRPSVPAAAPLPPNAAAYEGWYESDSPRVELNRFLNHLLPFHLGRSMRVHFQDGKMLVTYTTGVRTSLTDTFVPVAGMQFRRVPEKEPVSPIASAILVDSNAEGTFIQLGEFGDTWKRLPTWLAMTQIALSTCVYLAMVSIVVYAPFWLLGGLVRRRRRPAERGMKVWPLLAVVCLIGAHITLGRAGTDIFGRLDHLTVWSFAVFLLSVASATASLAGTIACWRAPRQETRRGVRIYSVIVCLALLIAATYVGYWEAICLRTWV
jgi:CubicO group peptidase (beta-lactamase class C family)